MMKLSRMLALLIVLLYPSSLAAQANQGGSSSDNQTIESIKKDIDSLMAERTRLVAEVAEIDQEVVFLREAANRLLHRLPKMSHLYSAKLSHPPLR